MPNTFLDYETKAEMNSMAVGRIEVVMGELDTYADKKVISIARILSELNQAWNMKKDSSPQGAPKETIQPQCTIDLARVESLVGFPLIERGPACSECDCFGCKHLYYCHLISPSTLHYCGKKCKGMVGIGNCEDSDKS